ncbi:MAG: rod shape-determining protein RodA [Proteobacteria bacterium]|nr:rod shape-determining protein RodA [Pseudomonadota bacterium]
MASRVPATRMTFLGKVLGLHWLLMLVICFIATIGFAMLYSVLQGDFAAGAGRQMIVFGFGMLVMIGIALVHIKVWFQMSYVIYGVALALLIGVEVMGVMGGGAQRWLDLGPVRPQPSEIMKIAVVMALARYYHGLSLAEVLKYRTLLIPAVLIALPSILVLRQPDLGTTILLVAGGVSILYVAGAPRRLFIAGAILSVVVAIVGFYQLRDYQRDRIMTFLDPSSDPTGTGWHITQSKIAFGSGGAFGKGFMQGTQIKLDFLPEKQTDFIFVALAEEFGFVGCLSLLALYTILLAFGYVIALSSKNQFGRLLGIGLSVTFFLYVFINIAMVMGLLPVVGVPLPLVSFGGSAMMTFLIGMGFLMSVHIHRDVGISRQGHIR